MGHNQRFIFGISAAHSQRDFDQGRSCVLRLYQRCNMDRYVIKGGTPLSGDVVIGGAKNAALGILAAAIMTDGV